MPDPTKPAPEQNPPQPLTDPAVPPMRDPPDAPYRDPVQPPPNDPQPKPLRDPDPPPYGDPPGKPPATNVPGPRTGGAEWRPVGDPRHGRISEALGFGLALRRRLRLVVAVFPRAIKIHFARQAAVAAQDEARTSQR